MTPQTDTQLRNALLNLAADISAHHQPRPASRLWLRAQRRGRQQAIARATLPLRIMQALGILAAFIVAAFALHQFQPTALTFSAGLWISLATIFLLAGCASTLLLGRSTPSASASH